MSAPVVRLPVWRGDDGEGNDPPARPRTRGDCVDGPRPCPWASCTHHAIHGVLIGQSGATLDDDAAAALVETMPASCTLDVADGRQLPGDADDGTLQAIADVWGVTRERIRQIESCALKDLRWAARQLREVLIEEPEITLRPSRCGPVPASERATWTDPPARHAHLPGPAGVADGETEFWCGHLGTALRASLCAKRHLARGTGSAMSGTAGRSYPTYPECARCADGVRIASRVGAPEALAPQGDAAPAVAARSIDWMGDGDDSPAEVAVPEAFDTPAPEPTPTPPDALPDAAQEPEMKKVSRASKAPSRSVKDPVPSLDARVTAPAPGAVCRVFGCTEPPQGYRPELDPLLRPLCKKHRLLAQGERAKRVCSTRDAVDIILRRAAAHSDAQGELEPASPAPTPHADEAPAAASVCAIVGCENPRGKSRRDVRPELASYCGAHRESVRNALRATAGDYGLAARRIEALLRAGLSEASPAEMKTFYEREGLTVPEPETAPELERAALAAPPDTRALDELHAETERLRAVEKALREESDHLCALRREADARIAELVQQLEEHRAQARADARTIDELRRDALTTKLERADARIAELEGQLLANATHQPARPLARLTALAAVLLPGSETIAWTVGRDQSGTRSCAEALGHDEAQLAGWSAVADTPDEALAALVIVLEARVQARIAELAAVLGGTRWRAGCSGPRRRTRSCARTTARVDVGVARRGRSSGTGPWTRSPIA